MTQIQTFKNASFEVQCICVKGDAWFKGKDIANILGYKNTKDAMLDHVDDDTQKFEELSRGPVFLPLAANPNNAIFINESGLYFLI